MHGSVPSLQARSWALSLFILLDGEGRIGGEPGRTWLDRPVLGSADFILFVLAPLSSSHKFNSVDTMPTFWHGRASYYITSYYQSCVKELH